MKKFSRFFIYASILFLLYALWHANYLVVPHFPRPWLLIPSGIFLVAGFFMIGVAWSISLKCYGLDVTLKDAVSSIGITIYSKYIPGKVWMFLGPAAFLGARYNYTIAKLSSVSFYYQILLLWFGLIISAVGLAITHMLQTWFWLLGGTILLLTVFIFSTHFSKLVTAVVKKVLKKEFVLPVVKPLDLIKVGPWCLGVWFSWMVGFYFLIAAMTEAGVNFSAGFGFVFSSVIGILAIIAPGGLGVREGIIIAYLVKTGLSPQHATSIAVVSRLWFLIGETCYFLVSFLVVNAHRFKSKNRL